MDVFKRWPKLHVTRQDHPIVKPEDRNQYPSLKNDFDILEQELMNAFYELEYDALVQQNKYRRLYVILIVLGAFVTICGIFQIAYSGTDWVGALQAISAAILAGFTIKARTSKSKEYYFNSRLAAEHLRSIYFLFLSRQHPFENEHTRGVQLEEEVRLTKWRAIH